MNLFSFIKTHIPIIAVVQEYTALKPAGVYWKGLCPFHSEKTSSFTVSPHKDIFYCFGCHASGDVISFIARLENMAQIEAARYLIEKYHLKVPSELLRQAEENDKHFDDKSRYYQLCALVTQWCQEQLHKYKDAQHYLIARGFTKKIIDDFQLGYFPPQSIPHLISFIGKKQFLVQDLIEAHIIQQQKNDFYTGFEDRIMFPIKNAQGDFCGFGGRIFKEHDDRVKYYNSKEHSYFAKGTILYGLHEAKKAIQQENTVFLVEGYVDCLAMAQHGFTNTVATLGTACTPEHLKLLSRFAELVYVMYDGDTAGQKAILRLTELAWHANLEIRVIPLPTREDPASYLQKHGTILPLIQQNQRIYTYCIQATKKEFNAQGLADKIQGVKKLIAIVRKLQDPVKQSLLLQEIAQEFGMPVTSLKKELELERQEITEHVVKDQVPSLELQIVGAVLHDRTLLEHLFSPIKELLSPSTQHMMKRIKIADSLSTAIEDLSPDEQQAAIKSYIYVQEKQVQPADLLEQFQKTNWKRIISLLKERLGEADRTGNVHKKEELLKQFGELKEKFLRGPHG